MGNSYSAEVWLDERRWDALEAALEEQCTNIEKYLQDYLVDLYREMVPADQVREIESCIKQERQEELREAEARKVFSVFRLWDGGKSRCLATEYPKEFLDVARLRRKCLPAYSSWTLTKKCSQPSTFWTAGKAIGSRM